MDSLDIVVVGAGIGGLGSALALARAGHHVTLVERDDTPMPDDAESAFEWDRRGAPQVRHPHVFLGLARTILRDRFPDVLQTLSAMGVEPPPMRAGATMPVDEATLAVLAADDDIRMLPCRRTTFEWVMRKTVLAEPGIDLRLGVGVAGLEVRASEGGPPVVIGVRTEDGTVIAADLVVPTTGRRGDIPAWLAEHDIVLPETVGDCGVVYFSRFYRVDHDEGFGFRIGFGAGIGAGVIGSDAGTYSITAVVPKDDKEMRTHLSDSDRFDATMRLLPELGDVTAAGGTAIQPVHCMTGLINRVRRFRSADGTPLVQGMVAVGDAHTCTNPAYGRGQSLALRQAIFLTDALAKADDVSAAAVAYEDACAEHVEPWYHNSVMTDQMRAAAVAGAGGDIGAGSGAGDFGALFSNAGADPELVRTVMRVMNLLEPPSVLTKLMSELQASAAARPRPPRSATPRPTVARPTREAVLAVTG